jgi:hypothetical protein
VIAVTQPRAICLVRVDDWIDSKWLEFSGKAVGAVGVWNAQLTVPPFHPNRVYSEQYFARTSASEYAETDGVTLHRAMPSSTNVTRHLDAVAPGCGDEDVCGQDFPM